MSEWQSQSEADRVLRGLAQVQPPSGLERRVLQRLREEQMAVGTARWQMRGGWLVAATVALVAVVWVAGMREWNDGFIQGPRLRQSAKTTPEVRDMRGHPEAAMLTRLKHLSSGSAGRAKGHGGPFAAASPAARRTNDPKKAGVTLLLPQDSSESEANAPEDGWQAGDDVARPALPGVEHANVPGHPLPGFNDGGVPGRTLPKLQDGSTPGRALPPFDIAATPGHPLPTFAEATNSGDQP